jgi:hypothetical protein
MQGENLAERSAGPRSGVNSQQARNFFVGSVTASE